jgi:hypothetical protein
MKIFLRAFFSLGMWMCMAVCLPLFAQDPFLVASDHRQVLEHLSDSLRLDFERTYQRSLDQAAGMGLKTDFITSEGVRFSLQRIENGLPFYLRTFNQGGAITTATDKLYAGGEKRLSLSGRALTAGVWDGGMVYHTHPEFDGRVVNVNIGSEFDDHATHVAGIIAAGGIDAKARGMAYRAGIRGYYWHNDLSEMAGEASKGMLISNHSYGISLGWTWRDGEWEWMGPSNADEDYRFGFYSQTSRAIDQVAFNAPHYLIVWAAGNDRSDVGDGSKPRDGPYDTVGPEGVAKNVLTVGAVNGIAKGYAKPIDVTRTAFSSWGPTDDGRVKPDLVTKGSQVYSTDVDGGYSTKSGTSMASPMAAGSLLLIQELYHSLSGGDYLRAASLKGLAIHTTNQAGYSPGPDYEYGWGLLDVGKMADFLIGQDDENLVFVEDTLWGNQTFTYEFFADGLSPVVATISWTDPAGTPVSQQLNPEDPMLVNDLDMRIFFHDSTEFKPWILNPAIPSLMPSTGDNFRDNVEKIFVDKPKEGQYTLVISHKNTLRNGHQAFSLFLQNGNIPQKKTYYWIGKSGDWDNGINWSLESGGEPANMVPGENDHVVLDINSFSFANQKITLQEDAACYTLTVDTKSMGFIDLNGFDLQIAQSVFAEKEFIGYGHPGRVVFNGDLKIGVVSMKNQSELAEQSLELVFDNPDGSWHITDDLRAGSILLRQGHLLFGEVEVSIRELVVEEAAGPASLTLGQAVMTGLERVVLPANFASFSGGKATMVFGHDTIMGDESLQLMVGQARLEKLISNNPLEITGELSVNEFDNHSEVVVSGMLTANKLTFSETAGFFLNDNTRLLVGEVFEGAGQAGQLVRFAGTGNQTGIAGSDGKIFCLDYVHVVNLPTEGRGAFNAGPNSLLEDAPGWFALPCDEVILSDFRVVSPCVGSWTFFEDQSTAGVETWDWQFGESGSSVQQSPRLVFDQPGSLDVSLTVSKDGLTHVSSQEVTIIENTLPAPVLYVSGTTYIVDIEGVSYQWYRDGTAIEGATSRTYDNAAAVDGVFTALISDGVCNRPSKNELVTNAGPQPEQARLMRVFPNPAAGVIMVESDQPMDELAVFDMSGRRLLQINPQANQYQLDVGAWMPGIYLLRAMTDKGVMQQKIQVVH